MKEAISGVLDAQGEYPGFSFSDYAAIRRPTSTSCSSDVLVPECSSDPSSKPPARLIEGPCWTPPASFRDG
jgi:hypothetical protein